MSDQPCQVPLVERLRSVPSTAHAVLEITWKEHRNIPYGPWCHEAADEIDRLSQGPHSCSDSCQRPLCVMRRDLTALLAIADCHLTGMIEVAKVFGSPPDKREIEQRRVVDEIKQRRGL